MKRTALALTLISALLISSTVVAQSAKLSPKTIVVPDDFPTIRKAIDNASAGDTVFVRTGYYDLTAEGYTSGGMLPGFVSLSIQKSISLIGENSSNTILNVAEDYEKPWGIGIAVNADNVTISGFTIIGNKTIIGLGANCTLSNNVIQLNTTADSGLAVSTSAGDMISSNIIEAPRHGDTPYGVFLLSGSDAICTGGYSVISNNVIRNFAMGIAIQNSSCNVNISSNTFLNNGVGLNCLSIPNVLYGNNFENSSLYNIYSEAQGNINATCNWWGTTNKQEIGQKIFESKNDLNSGTVTFEPFLTQPNPEAIPSSEQQPKPEAIPIFLVVALIVAAVSVAVAVALAYWKKRQR